MRSLLVAATVVATAAVATPEADFKDFKAKYNKVYSSAAEESKRFAIFQENMKIAAAIQSQNPHATFGASPYADMSQAEFKSRHNAEKVYAKKVAEAHKDETIEVTAEQVAAAEGKSINWNDKGAVTHVKNQGDCGSCWSFSTTGGVEGQWFLAGNTLTSLSEQLFVSCDTTDNGCHGGLMDNAFKWAINDNDGNLVTAASYPYVSGMGEVPPCDKSGKTFGAHITGFKNLPHSESKMAAWVYQNGPLSIAVDATTWQTYTGGILTNCANQQLDHGVLIVGFDDAHDPPYWTIKNSWGPSWGEQGFLRVKKGTNECLINNYPCTSIVGKEGPTSAPEPTSTTPGPQPPSPWTPAPQPPSPWTPAPQAPSPSGSSFTQKICPSSGCQSGCQSHQFPQNTCLKLQGGGSAKAQCSGEGLTMTEYPISSDCSGFSIPTTQPINQCVEDNNGSFLENICSNTNQAVKFDAKVRSTRKL